ncbi:PsiF family protein [Caenimonas koreensis]|uniref:PsiF repeat-containing protein n=1 Tax=Caenimonas koreensis DSM 17982 TaxID=1121255 RepID=A0A844AYV8_9BURK|nr:PsiF family protein [Caenimonas koreensis]MRD49224.1 hypothetical protein [Caenimonas koreensis DSM 17982]
MKQIISTIVIGAILACGNAYAAKDADTASAPAAKTKTRTKQQTKMADCNKGAKEKALKGDERKKFMSSCLRA